MTAVELVTLRRPCTVVVFENRNGPLPYTAMHLLDGVFVLAGYAESPMNVIGLACRAANAAGWAVTDVRSPYVNEIEAVMEAFR
jgi:hypothetical protein